jgi:hypothetical protein
MRGVKTEVEDTPTSTANKHSTWGKTVKVEADETTTQPRGVKPRPLRRSGRMESVDADDAFMLRRSRRQVGWLSGLDDSGLLLA